MRKAGVIGVISGVVVAAALIGAFLLGRSTSSTSANRATTTTVDAATKQATQQFLSAVKVVVQQFGAVRSETFPTGDDKIKTEGPPFHAFAQAMYAIDWSASDVGLQQHQATLANEAQALWAADIQLDIRNEDPTRFIAAEWRVAKDLGIHAPCPFALPSNAIGYDPRCTP